MQAQNLDQRKRIADQEASRRRLQVGVRVTAMKPACWSLTRSSLGDLSYVQVDESVLTYYFYEAHACTSWRIGKAFIHPETTSAWSREGVIVMS